MLCNWNDLPLSILTDTIKPLWGRKLIRRQYRKISKDWIWVPLLNWLYIVFLPCLISVACFFPNFWYAKTCSTYSISIMLMQHFCLYLGKSSNIYIFWSLFILEEQFVQLNTTTFDMSDISGPSECPLIRASAHPLETLLFYPVPLESGPRLWPIVKTLQIYLIYLFILLSMWRMNIGGKILLCKFCFKWVD